MELNSAMLVKIAFTFFLIFFILTFAFALNQMGEKNDFQQMANLEIERHGGLTPTALEKIIQYSDVHFNGRFKVLSPTTEKVQIFEKVIYTYSMTITPLFFTTTALTFKFEGQTVSLVR